MRPSRGKLRFILFCTLSARPNTAPTAISAFENASASRGLAACPYSRRPSQHRKLKRGLKNIDMRWCTVLRAVAEVAAVTLRPAVAFVQPSRLMTFAAPHRGQTNLATPGACHSSAAHLPRHSSDFGVIPGSGVQTGDAGARVLSGRISRARDVAELAALVDTFGREFNYFHVTSAITRLPKIMPHVQPNSMSERIVSERVLELARAHVGEMDGVGVATVLWGVGKLGMDHVELLDDLEAVLPVHLHTLNARHVANVWWAYGKLGRRPSEHVGEELLAAVEQNLSGLNPQGVANIAWAMAHLNMEGAREALNLLERRALGLLRKQAPNVGRGGPTMPLSTAFPGFNTHGVGQWAVFNPQEVANLVWAFATLKYRPNEQFLHHALAHATPKLANFQPQEIANLAWGLATLRRHNVSMPPGIDKFLPVLEQQVLRRLPEFKPSEISQVLMAFAVLAPSRALSSAVASAGISDSSRSASGSMVDAVAHTVASSAHKYNPNDVANTLYGFARMGHHPGTEVLGRLVKAVGQHNLSRSSDVSLSMILWSCAQLNFSQPAAGLRSILDELRGRDATAPGIISSSMWAAAVLEMLTPELFSDMATQFSRCLGAAKAEEQRAVLYAKNSLSGVTAVHTPEVEAMLVEATKASQSQRQRPSRLLKEVGMVLRVMGIEHRMEVAMGDGLYVADILLSREEAQPLALQLDSRWNYLSNNPNTPLGSTVLRDRCLARHGLQVAVLHTHEWLKLQSTAERMEFLQRFLLPFAVRFNLKL